MSAGHATIACGNAMSRQDMEPESGQARQEATPPPARKSAAGDQVPAWYALTGIGLEFLATICAAGALGWWLDSRWHTFPWLTIAGIAVGFAAGLTLMIRAANRSFRK